MNVDHHSQDIQSDHSGSSHGSFKKRYSLSFHIDDAIDSDSVSEAGDIGDRVMSSDINRTSSFEGHISVVPIHVVTVPTEVNKDEREAPWLLAYTTYLLSLAVFGILGVLARYGLKILFGRKVVGLTNDTTILYPDLPANVVGSFLMGWLGLIFKGDISEFSDQLAVGLTTGFLGSLTTFSGWNQSVLNLSSNGHWSFAVLCILIGFMLVVSSIVLGVWTARAFKFRKSKRESLKVMTTFTASCKSKKLKCLVIFFVILLLLLVLLWGLFASLTGEYLRKESNGDTELYIGCLVGPFGVVLRWYLARLNGLGLGKKGRLKWIPFGTLAANILAACVMAALATLIDRVQRTTFDTVAMGLQLGMLGCLSTVSTFMAEVYAMGESTHPLRSVYYAATTIVPSFGFETLIYSVPLWMSK